MINVFSPQMTYAKNIPIYNSTYNYAREIYRIKTKLPKNIKNDLGKESCESAIKILKCVVVANKAQEKSSHLSRLLLETEVQWVLLRLLFDLKGISSGEFKVLSERLAEIEKQAGAWFKWEKGLSSKKTANPPPMIKK